MITKLLTPRLNLSLVQPRLLHDVLDIARGEHEARLAGEHGTLEASNTLVGEAWHGGCGGLETRALIAKKEPARLK